MKRCKHCQAEIDDDALYCPRCGTRQGPVIATPPEEEETGRTPLHVSSGRAIAGMSLGVLSIIFAALLAPRLSVFELLVTPGSIAGIVLSATSLRTHDPKARVGFITSIIGTVISVSVFTLWFMMWLIAALRTY